MNPLIPVLVIVTSFLAGHVSGYYIALRDKDKAKGPVVDLAHARVAARIAQRDAEKAELDAWIDSTLNEDAA